MTARDATATGLLTIGLTLTALLGDASSSFAQPSGTEMCGDGTTFEVTLPGTSLGVDDSEGFFKNISVPSKGPDDVVTLPNGCRIYAILVSGFNQNEGLTDIPFYEVAEFVAQNNGYVHVSWWNNFVKEYMARPLHRANIVVEKANGTRVTIATTPGDGFGGFAPSGTDVPKANPDEDIQFQSDAALVIKAIRAHNPNALIVVVGHSMGGGAVIRLGKNQSVPIDLLAPIDPVGNRDMPRGQTGSDNYNWTRWRATHNFKGYRQWDCTRDASGGCADVDPRLLFKAHACGPTGPFLNTPPKQITLAPLVCPRAKAYADPGTLLGFDTNIKRLYHRWQYEYLFPFDYEQTYRLGFWTSSIHSIFGANYQEPVPEALATLDPDKTCKQGEDPRDQTVNCDATDGHGEVLGYRGVAGKLRLGLELLNGWPSNAAARRTALTNLPVENPWAHRPKNPDLCMVCDDIIASIRNLLGKQVVPPPPSDTTAPVAVAAATPDPNAAGWNNTDVVVDVTAEDEVSGSGVKEIEITVNGVPTTTAGNAATATADGEGTTSLAYLARDNAGNASAAQTLDVQIDKTPPMISADTDPPANANGWHNGSVTITFVANDALSGVASISGSAVLGTEGAQQEVVGLAIDIADNESSATAIVSIDKTPPIVVAKLSLPANARGWHNQDVLVTFVATDALSGVQSVSPPVLVGIDGASQPVTGTAADRAGNVATVTVVINLDKTPPEADVRFDPRQRRIKVSGRDELSGIPDRGVTQTGTDRRPRLGHAFRYRIEDRAGNALVVDTNELRAAGYGSLSITSLNYGLGKLLVQQNETVARWTVRKEALHLVEQFIEADQERDSSTRRRVAKQWAYADFNAKRGTTHVWSSTSGPARHKKQPGLALIQLRTSNGRLDVAVP